MVENIAPDHQHDPREQFPTTHASEGVGEDGVRSVVGESVPS